MLDQVASVTDVIECLDQLDQRVIVQAVFNSACSVLGSATALEVKYAQAGRDALDAPWVPESEESEVRAVEVREVDSSAYEARIHAVHWLLANTGVPDRIVRPQFEAAWQWLRKQEDKDDDGEDGIAALAELGTDAETIEKGRKVSEQWRQARSERKGEILDSIAPRTIDEVCSVVDAANLSIGELSLVVDWIGKAVHKAEIDAVARVLASSWSKRRQAEAISDAAVLTKVIEMLDAIELPDTRDVVSDSRQIW